MKHFFISIFCLAIILCVNPGCANKITPQSQTDNKIMASSMAPVIPVLKRMAHNPLLRIRVFIPAGMGHKNYRSIQCSIDENALKDFKDIKVYTNGTEPLFNAQRESSSFTPTSNKFDLPINMNMIPGLNYIWIGASLKEDARIDHEVLLQANALTDAQGSSQTIINESAPHCFCSITRWFVFQSQIHPKN